MSAPVRFLALVLVGWGGVRAVTLGAVPGFTMSYAKERPASGLPPIVPTRFPPLPPVEAEAPQPWPSQQFSAGYGAYPPMAMPAGYYAPYPYPYPYPYPGRYAVAEPQPEPIPPRPSWHLAADDSRPLDWQVSSLPVLPLQQSRPIPTFPGQPEVQPRQDRLQLTSWVLLRGPAVPGSLATGGTLGGSQAGARLTYNFNRWLAASLRTTSPLGGPRGTEAAAGIRVTPFRSIPVAITAERRQAFGHGVGRSAFALFAEGGLYHRPMPLRFTLDGYVQAGIVGFNSRDLFVDGALSLTRPVWGRVSAGFGLWGGAQTGAYRLDGGPRISLRLRDNIYAHVDWRQRLAGRAQPSSGPALTVAADF